MQKRVLLTLLFLWSCGPQSNDQEEAETPSSSELTTTKQALVTDRIPGIYQGYYRIYERQRSRSIDISSNNPNNAWGNSDFHGRFNQQFMIIPVAPDDDVFYIAARHKGGVLDVSTRFPATGNVDMFDGYPTGANNQRFYLTDTPNNGFFNIRPMHTSHTLDVSNTASRNNRLYAFAGSPTGGDNQKFRFLYYSPFPYPMPSQTRGTAPGAIGDVPRMTSFESTPPQNSPPVLIGEVAVPFIFVKNDGNRTFQVQQTPYYQLVRHQFYRRTEIIEKPAGISRTETYTVKTGMAYSESVSMEVMLQTILKSDGTFGFTDGPLKLSLGRSMEQKLQVTTRMESTKTYTEERTLTRTTTFPADKRVRWTEWRLMDRYTLKRMNGTVVDTWELIYGDDNRAIMDAYMQ